MTFSSSELKIGWANDLPVNEYLCPGFKCFPEDLFWYSSRINIVQVKVLLPLGSPFQYYFPFIATRILLNIFIQIILIFIVNAMPPWSFDHDTLTIFMIIITVLVIMVIIFMATRIPRNYFGGRTASTRLFRQSGMITFLLGKCSKNKMEILRGSGFEVPLTFFFIFSLKNRLESFPDCQNAFCTVWDLYYV